MSPDVFLALLGFALVASITPGPNTLMLLASGVNFGFRRTIPHMLGICVGFAVMLFVVGIGLGELIEQSATFNTVLKVVSVLYMAWLSWKIATSGPINSGKSNRTTTTGTAQNGDAVEMSGSPMSFLGAALFQWVNPKAWAMGVAAIAAYTSPDNYMTTVLLVVAAFTIVAGPSVAFWAGFGVQVRRFLSSAGRIRVFNITMAVLLMASLSPVMIDLWQDFFG